MKNKFKYYILLFLVVFMLSCWKEIDNKSINDSKVIVALGDSLTFWYWLDEKFSYPSILTDILNKNWYNYKVINWWISWNTSKQLLDRISDFDEYKNAEIYLLNIWANDWLRKMNLDDMKENIIEIIKYLKEINPNWKIILFSIKLPITFGLWYSSDFNNVIKNISDKYDIAYFWNFLEDVQWKRELNLLDRMHPNEKWYEIISNNIYNYLIKNNYLKNK